MSVLISLFITLVRLHFTCDAEVVRSLLSNQCSKLLMFLLSLEIINV